MHGLEEVGVHHWLHTFGSHLCIGLETGMHCPALSFEPEKSKTQDLAFPMSQDQLRTNYLWPQNFLPSLVLS